MDIDIIGVPIDLGADRRGADMGPAPSVIQNLAGLQRIAPQAGKYWKTHY